MHNADNSGTAGSTRRTVGLSGFIVLQTFNSQVGYLGCNLINKTDCVIDQKFKSHFPNWLIRWVKANVDESYERQSFFWHHILRDVTCNESEAIELFFKLCNKFFKEIEP